MHRCPWCEGFELYRHYHDTEWGVPLHDDRALFELINLEGAQAGLSWSTVLKKRETYRLAFDQFDPEIPHIVLPYVNKNGSVTGSVVIVIKIVAGRAIAVHVSQSSGLVSRRTCLQA